MMSRQFFQLFTSRQQVIYVMLFTLLVGSMFGIRWLGNNLDQDTVVQINEATRRLVTEDFSSESLTIWQQEIAQSDIAAIKPKSDQISDPIWATIQSYTQNYQFYNQHHWVKLEKLNYKIISKDLEIVPFAEKTQTDDSFPKDEQYLLTQGKPGEQEWVNIKLEIGPVVSPQLQFAHQRISEPQDQVTVVGTLSSKELANKVQASWEQQRKALSGDSKVATRDKTYKLNSIQLGDITFQVQNLQNQVVPVGKVKVQQNKCSAYSYLKLNYLLETKEYELSGWSTALDHLCDQSDRVVLMCEDCWQAPVDKVHQLPSSYQPAVQYTNLPGGGQLTKPTIKALGNLFQFAKQNGFELEVSSAYRSYTDQENTFGYWVQTEINQGYSRAEAEARANVYSARPGHSEHQLGTTVDLRCVGCKIFVETPENEKVYSFLQKHAHKYGFVMSYPANNQEQTGYKHEPWHWRYIGVDAATELYKTDYLTQKDSYSAKYLMDKGNY